jgi:hypothetical protein
MPNEKSNRFLEALQLLTIDPLCSESSWEDDFTLLSASNDDVDRLDSFIRIPTEAARNAKTFLR